MLIILMTNYWIHKQTFGFLLVSLALSLLFCSPECILSASTYTEKKGFSVNEWFYAICLFGN